jgi:hypothetical protein
LYVPVSTVFLETEAYQVNNVYIPKSDRSNHRSNMVSLPFFSFLLRALLLLILVSDSVFIFGQASIDEVATGREIDNPKANALLARLKLLRRRELSYGLNHPSLPQLRQQIAELEEELFNLKPTIISLDKFGTPLGDLLDEQTGMSSIPAEPTRAGPNWLQVEREDLLQWHEGTTRRGDGATWEYFNREAYQRWLNPMGDWYDRNGDLNGGTPYASGEVSKFFPCRIDVSQMIKEWALNVHVNRGMLIRGEAGNVRFASKEYAKPSMRPKLIIDTVDGAIELFPVADTCVTRASRGGAGDQGMLRVGEGFNTLIRFPVPAELPGGEGIKATLVLHSLHADANTKIEVYRAAPGSIYRQKNEAGDSGIALLSSDVLFKESFESLDWKDRWDTVEGAMSRIDPLGSEVVEDRGDSHTMETSKSMVPKVELDNYKALRGSALCCWLPANGHNALSLIWFTRNAKLEEFDELYMRYYIRLGLSWEPRVSGKLPGFAGRYGKAGWGGRKVHGDDGWSARGVFLPLISQSNPMRARTPIGHYSYHMDQADGSGDIWPWDLSTKTLLEKRKWYCIEQHVRLNDPGKRNGLLEAWVDDELAFTRSDIAFRSVSTLKIEEVWMNVYHGGKAPSPTDQYLFIDEIAVSRTRLGPLDASEASE